MRKPKKKFRLAPFDKLGVNLPQINVVVEIYHVQPKISTICGYQGRSVKMNLLEAAPPAWSRAVVVNLNVPNFLGAMPE